MMEAGWADRRVARQFGRSDCVPTASSTAIQAQVAPSLGVPVSSRTKRKYLAEGHLRSRRPLRLLPLTPTHRRLRLEWCRARGNWTAAEWNQVVFSDESRLNLSSDDNRVRVRKLRGERLNSAFTLQRHTTPTAGVMVWGTIAYITRSPLVLIRGTMTAPRYIHDILQPHVWPPMQQLPGAIFQQDNARHHTARVSQDYLRTVTTLFLACPISRFVSDREYLGSFGMVSWAAHEFERTRDKVTANMEQNVSRHHTELVCLIARSYRIVHLR
ncbi:transposable element Tcb1 transposase [Trichonephila clavipes]|nr:transposable element Tcb1 transposase [Trichonephila clavipes]